MYSVNLLLPTPAYKVHQPTSPFLPLYYEFCLTDLSAKASCKHFSYGPEVPGHQRPGR